MGTEESIAWVIQEQVDELCFNSTDKNSSAWDLSGQQHHCGGDDFTPQLELKNCYSSSEHVMFASMTACLVRWAFEPPR